MTSYRDEAWLKPKQPFLPPALPVPALLVSSALAWEQGEQLRQGLQEACLQQMQQAGLWQAHEWLELVQAPAIGCPTPLPPTPAVHVTN